MEILVGGRARLTWLPDLRNTLTRTVRTKFGRAASERGMTASLDLLARLGVELVFVETENVQPRRSAGSAHPQRRSDSISRPHRLREHLPCDGRSRSPRTAGARRSRQPWTRLRRSIRSGPRCACCKSRRRSTAGWRRSSLICAACRSQALPSLRCGAASWWDTT